MIKTAFAIIAGLFLTIQVSHAQTYNSLTGYEARQILDSVGMESESQSEGPSGSVKIRFEDGKGKSTMYLTACSSGKKCKRMQLHAGYSMSKKPSMGQINEWNKSKLFSRAYLDSDGDPHLESDIDIEGGVSRETIRDFFRTYRISVRAFTEHINFE